MAGAARDCLEDVLDRSRAWEVALPALKDAGFLRREYQRPSVDEEVKALQQMMLQEHPPREEAEPAVSVSKRKGDDVEQFSGLRKVHLVTRVLFLMFLCVFRVQATKESA